MTDSGGAQGGIGAEEVAQFLAEGHLEHLETLFRHTPSLYALAGDLARDERMVVRLGVAAMLESLAGSDPEGVLGAAPPLAALLGSESPTVRGDAAYLLGVIGAREASAALRSLLDDGHGEVREAAEEALEALGEGERRGGD